MLKAARDLELVNQLLNDYQTDSLSTLKIILTNQLPYKCPKCNGKGTGLVEYNAYPMGLPDSGCVYEPGYKTVTCDICNGDGYTKEKIMEIKEVIGDNKPTVIGYALEDNSKRWPVNFEK